MSEYDKTLTIQQALDLAVRHHNEGRLSQAERIYHQVLHSEPNQPTALHLLGVISYQMGKINTAINLISKALQITPEFAEAHNNLGIALKDLGKLHEATTSYRNALNINSDYAEAHNNLGFALLNLDKAEEAVASFEKALAIKPNYAEAYNNLGNALQALGKFADASASYNKALSIKPDYPKPHFNQGNALAELGKLEEAAANYRRALVLNPDYAEAHNNLGNILQELGRPREAMSYYRKALAINPDFAEAHNNLGNAFKEDGKLVDAVNTYRRALDLRPDLDVAHSNIIFCMSYLPNTSNLALFEEAQRWNANHGYSGPLLKHINTPDPDRRLRVGLVSGDLHHHSVSYFLETILLEIDKERIEIYAYATSNREDDLTNQLKRVIPKWRTVAGISDKRLAENIIADNIDILVDLSGHTNNNRLKMFSRKPAPVQVTWLGYPGTTGVKEMDYIFCDRWVLPPNDEPYFVEKPWRLPDSWLCFTPPGKQDDVGTLPALNNGHITFGSFNNLTKLSEETVQCWAKIIESVPNSRLLLKALQLEDTLAQEAIRARFATYGVSYNQLVLKGFSRNREEHLRALNEVDIALDPFPYPGGRTTVESFWMGAPVVTLKGDRFVSRIGESLLQNMDLEAWIADTPEDYVKKTRRFATDAEALSLLRRSLRDRLLQSTICDAKRFTRNLETSFQEMWRERCSRKSS